MYRLFPALALAVLGWVGCGTTTNASGAAVACVNGACAAGQSCVNGYCVVSQVTDTVGGQDAGTATGATFIGACESAKCASQIGLCAGGCATWLTCAQKCLETDAACQTACAQKAASDTVAAAAIQSVLQCVAASAPACTASVDATNSPDVGGEVTADTGPASQWPTWQLPDINQASSGFKTTYGMDTYAGSRVVLGMLSGTSTNSKTFAAQLVGNAGTSTVVFIVDSPPDPTLHINLSYAATFVDQWANHSIQLPDGTVHAGTLFDIFAYDTDGRPIGFFGGAMPNTKNFGSFQQFLNDVENAPVGSKTWFVNCPAGASGAAGVCTVTK